LKIPSLDVFIKRLEQGGEMVIAGLGDSLTQGWMVDKASSIVSAMGWPAVSPGPGSRESTPEFRRHGGGVGAARKDRGKDPTWSWSSSG